MRSIFSIFSCRTDLICPAFVFVWFDFSLFFRWNKDHGLLGAFMEA